MELSYYFAPSSLVGAETDITLREECSVKQQSSMSYVL